jgi:hypothetical protein
MLAGNMDFMFDPPGLVDSFGLLGRFWHWAEQNPLFEEYKNSRLPWILPGFVLHRLFETVTASYILHATALLGSSIALYLVVRDTLKDKPAAAVAAAAWSCYTWLHGDGGWNYQTLAACTCYLLSMWMFARSSLSQTPARMWAFAGGAALACAIHTHLVFAGFVPVVALLYAVRLSGQSSRRGPRLASAALHGLLGGVSVTAVLAAINAATGGPWLFFLPQIEFAVTLTSGNRWLVAPRAWIPVAGHHLVIPCLIVAGGVIWAVARRFQGTRDDSLPAQFASILVYQGFAGFGLMAYLEFVARQTVLNPSHGAFPLYSHVFLMLGALLWRADRGHRWSAPAVLASALVIVMPLLLLLPWTLQRWTAYAAQFFRLEPSQFLLLPLIVGVIGLGLACRLEGARRFVCFALFFGLLNAWLAISQTSYGIATRGINRDTLRVIRSLDRYASSLDPTLFAIRFWREPEMAPGPYEPINLSWVYESFLSTRRRSLVTAAFDRKDIRAEELTRDDLSTERCLGVLSSTSVHPEVVRRIKRRFDALGLPLAEVGRHDTSSGPISVALTVLALPQDQTIVGYEDVVCPPRR